MHIDMVDRLSWRRMQFIWDDVLRLIHVKLSIVCLLMLWLLGCDGLMTILMNLFKTILLTLGNRILMIGRLCSHGCAMACITHLRDSRLSYISYKSLHWNCRCLYPLLILLYSPYLVKFVSVVIIGHYHIIFVICQVYWMVEIKAWFVFVEMHLSSNTVQNI